MLQNSVSHMEEGTAGIYAVAIAEDLSIEDFSVRRKMQMCSAAKEGKMFNFVQSPFAEETPQQGQTPASR